MLQRKEIRNGNSSEKIGFKTNTYIHAIIIIISNNYGELLRFNKIMGFIHRPITLIIICLKSVINVKNWGLKIIHILFRK